MRPSHLYESSREFLDNNQDLEQDYANNVHDFVENYRLVYDSHSREYITQNVEDAIYYFQILRAITVNLLSLLHETGLRPYQPGKMMFLYRIRRSGMVALQKTESYTKWADNRWPLIDEDETDAEAM